MKRLIPILVTLLLASTSFVGVSYNTEKSSPVSFDGKTLFVGGSGPGNYTNIQDAIDDASDGDTVFVYNGTYDDKNNNTVEKSINILGENRSNTFISNRIYIRNINFVNFSEFTISNTNKIALDLREVGHCNISNNNFIKTDGGIYTIDASYCIFTNNLFLNNNNYGIKLSYSNYNTITSNIFENNHDGIYIDDSYDNLIEMNKICNNSCGIYGIKGDLNIIIKNIIYYNEEGINILDSDFNLIKNNDIKFNSKSIIFGFFHPFGYRPNYFNKVFKNNIYQNDNNRPTFYGSFNRWRGNFWGTPRIMPYPIFGKVTVYPIKINFDFFPAKEPYDI